MATGFAVASFVVAAAGTVAQQRQQRKAAAAQKKAMKREEAATAAQQSIEQAKDDQQRRQQIREERQKRAMIIQSSVNNGTAYSSGEIGGVGALSTDYAANMSYINDVARNRGDAESYMAQSNHLWFKATEYQNKAATIGAYTALAQKGLSMGASMYNAGMFNGGTPPKDQADIGAMNAMNGSVTGGSYGYSGGRKALNNGSVFDVHTGQFVSSPGVNFWNQSQRR